MHAIDNVAQQAAMDVKDALLCGNPEVADADLVDNFGSIQHAELMRSLARCVVDRRVLHLIKMCLECAVEETDDRGRKKRTTEAKDQLRGIPQGSPLAPLLANRYMRRDPGLLEVVSTTDAAATINRRPQTLRKWACLECGPIRPVRIGGRLAWRVRDLEALLNGEAK